MAPRTLRTLLSCLVAALAPTSAWAIERQLSLTPTLGFQSSSGPSGGLGGVLGLNVGYGLSDAFLLYGVGQYGLAFPDDARRSPRHGATLAAGVVYQFDYISVVPYGGLGARVDFVSVPNDAWFTPSVEARLGVSWRFRRAMSLDLEGAYAFPFVAREQSGDFVTVTVGFGFYRDL